jgi:hypothetical protein
VDGEEMWKCQTKRSKEKSIVKCGQNPKANVKNDDLRQGNTKTHTKRYNGVSVTKEVSKKQNGPNEDY